MSIKTEWKTLLLLSLMCLYLWLGLVQPFQPVHQGAYVIGTLANTTLLKTRDGWAVFPAPYNYTLPPRSHVSLHCNQGEWIPVLFDCVNTLDVFPPAGVAFDL